MLDIFVGLVVKSKVDLIERSRRRVPGVKYTTERGEKRSRDGSLVQGWKTTNA